MFGAADAKVRAELYSELATMTKAGLTIGEALSAAGEDMRPSRLTRTVREMGDHVSAGESVSDAMEKRPRVFSSLEVANVRVGEETGRFESALRNLADYYEREFDLRHLLTRELAYPIVLFVAILFIPVIADLIRVWITESFLAALAVVAGRLVFYLLFIGLPVGLAAVAYFALSSSTEGKAWLDSAKMKLPMVGGVFRKIALARYCRALASLYSSGVLLGTSMRLAGEAAANEAVRRDLVEHAPEVDGGMSLSDAFAQSDLMPSSVQRMMKTGERTGDIDSMADNVANHLEQEARTSIKQLAVSITPVAVVIAGIIVALIVLNFYTNLYSF